MLCARKEWPYSLLYSTARADFTPASQNITFPAGSEAGSRQCIRVYIVDDRILEETEQFYISIYFDYYYYYYYYYDNDPPQEITLVNSFVNVLIVDNDCKSIYPPLSN